jgi:SAM-dependent methyltransferase
MKSLADLLRDPTIHDEDINGADRLELHHRMLARKKMLRDVFDDFHLLFNDLDRRFLSGEGMRLEIGAGVAPMRDSYPDVLATDIVYSKRLDKVINAEAMDVSDNSVRTIFGQNCFHHFPHPDRFFLEVLRVLVPGGGVILLEPYYGPIASLLYKRLFRTEGFDKNYPTWETPTSGPMNGANQALSYIVFNRDRIIFEKKYPQMEIMYEEPVSNYLRYLLSGGLNFRQLCPDSVAPLIRGFERCLWPLRGSLALHHIIVLRKKKQ